MHRKVDCSLGRMTVWVSWLVLIISSLDSSDGATLLPNKLHCSSTVFLHKSVAEEGTLLTYEKTYFEEYQVDEYLDLNLYRSSVSVFDVNRNKRGIYFNHISPNEQYTERQFTLFDPFKVSCREVKISDWLLADMRWIMIGMRLSIMDIERQRVDVPIGPSGMLYTIEETLDKYLYVGTVFSHSRLTAVDVFRRSAVYTTAKVSRMVSVIVHVAGRGMNKLQLNEPLSKLYEKAQELGTDPSASINIALIGACHVGSGDNDDAIERAPPQDKDPNADLQLGNNTFCRREKTLFVIHYNLVAAYSPGSLVGSTIEELGESRHYDYNREPLVMPTGIGCWGDNESASGWQKRLTRDNPMSQFSAEYVTTQGGERGVSFIAYDQQRSLVRIDRNGRKSVYDFLQSKSYHVGEFKEPHEVQSMKASHSDNADDGEEDMLRRCVALDTTNTSQIVSYRLITQQLLGLRPNTGREHYMGSRMIDHVNYEVFERQLTGEDIELPLILQISKSGVVTGDPYYVTYYVQSIVDSSSKKETFIPRYVELWQFFRSTGFRILRNRAEFIEFSWKLDVEPTNDPKSQHSDGLSLRLFDFDECYQERSAQAEILVDFERNEDISMSERLLDDLRRNRHAIAETIQSMLAETLEISALSVVDFKLRALDNGNLLASSKIVDLLSGLSNNELLGRGLLFTSSIFANRIQHTFHARYTLEECQLDSIAWSKPHWSAFCPNIALCVMLEPKDALKEELAKSQEKEHLYDICYVYSFRYSNYNPSRSAVHAAEVRSLYLARRNLTFDLANKDKANSTENTYVATPKLREFKELDAIGARLTNDASLLDGMRYSTEREMPSARNLNTRVHIPRESQLGAFRFCQLACQMDDLCGSFSVCKRSQKPNKLGERDDDCVLSSIRLEAQRVNELAHSSLMARREDKFMFEVAGFGLEEGKQQLVMFHDEACSLHSKDFVSEYENTKTFIRLGDTKQYEPKKKSQLEKGPLEKRHLSLDDCAGLSYEKTMSVDPMRANFTYCPLESNCILFGDDHKGHIDEMNGYCHVYTRRLTRPYDVRRMMHMVLTRRDNKNADDDKDEKPAVTKLDPMIEATRMESQNLVKKLWGLDEQSCAKECNLRRTHCLAFDSCRQSGKVLCVLFAIRSPLAKTSAYLPQLELERQTARQHEVALLNSLICDHFRLKPDYLEVRLKHLLELESGASAAEQAVNLVEDNADRDKLVEEREKLIEKEDEQKSNEEATKLESEVSGDKSKVLGANSAGASHANKWFHFGVLLIGLLLGAVGTTYNRQIGHAIATGYSWYKIRRAHNNDRMTNRLVLDDPFTT